MPSTPSISFLQLFRFSTPFEKMLNLIGIVAAIGAGAAQPLETIIFGNLANRFVYIGATVVSGTPAEVEEAKKALLSQINHQVLYMVYIGVGMFACAFIYYGTWTYTGERASRRIREKYLRAVLRQNVGWMDKVGAGEITTRIRVFASFFASSFIERRF